MRIVFSFILLIVCHQLNAQKNDDIIPRVIPPSPNATAIEKFSSIPVDYSTGIPSISYPMWSWKKNRLEYSIGLSYHAGGIKIDDMASNVGMGWALTGSGRVSRTVRGLPDDHFHGFFNTPDLPLVETYMNLNDEYNYTSKYPSVRETRMVNYGISDLNSPHSNLVSEINKGLHDGEQDVFSFNCLSLKGSFIIDKDREIHFLEKSNFKVQITFGNSFPNDPGKYGPIESFKITDDRGVEFFFEEQDIHSVETYPVQFPPISSNLGYVSSWLISRIKDPITSDEIIFNYTIPTIGSYYETGLTQSIHMMVGSFNAGDLNFNDSYSFQKINIIEPQIDNIVLSDGSIIEFEYTFNRDDLKYSKALTDIKVFNLRNELIKSFRLNYSYFSSGVNFYNPSWATSENDYNKRLKLEAVEEVSIDNLDEKITSFVYNDLQLNPRASFNQDYWGFNVNPNRNNLQLAPKMRLEDQEIAMMEFKNLYAGSANREPDEEYVKAGVLEKIIYPTGGFTEFEYECNQAFSTFNYYLNTVTSNNNNWTLNQFNFTKSLSFADRTDEKVIFKFLATEEDPRPPPPNPNEPQSCFETSQDDMLIRFEIYSSEQSFTTIVFEEPYSNLLAGFDRVVELPLTGTYTIKFLYNANVTCAFKYPFYATISTDHFIEPYDKPVGGLRIKSIKSNDGIGDVFVKDYNYNDENGKSSATLHAVPNFKYSRSTTDKSIDSPSEVKFIYTKQISITSNPNNTLHNFNGGPLVYKSVKEVSQDGSLIHREYDDLNYSSTGGPVDRTPFVPIQYFSNLSGLLLEELTKDASGNIISEKKCTYQKEFDNLLNQDENRNLRTAIYANTDGVTLSPWNYDATYYMCFQYFYKLSNLKLTKTEEKLFTESGTISTVTDYTHNSKNYVSAQYTTNSKNEENITTFSYPFITSSTNPIHDEMEQINMLNVITNTKQYKSVNSTNSLLSERENNYQLFNTTMLFPSSIQTAILGEPLNTDITFNQYDDKGNILQYTSNDGIVHSFIWGYNKQYPVAHVVGVDYNTASALVNLTVLNAATTTDQVMRTELDKLHSGITNQLSQVTTYTYIPLVGIKTVKDVNNKLITYEYDNFYRLKLVRDQDGNILSAQEYQYAQ
jgi:hypothetical protein